MPPLLVLTIWLCVTAFLLFRDPLQQGRLSKALWLPTIWIFIVATRLPSQWLGGVGASPATSVEEGDSLDRLVYLALLTLAVATLSRRAIRWNALLQRNRVLAVFLALGLVSCVWSDFPFVSFKRWIRDLGVYLVVLVALTDEDPREAVCAVFRRVAYLTLPLSVMLVKYFPELGIHFSEWTGAAEFAGATLSKNMLGVLCLTSGLFCFWDTTQHLGQRKGKQAKTVILINAGLFGLAIHLLLLCESMTSRLCLFLGCLTVAALSTRASWTAVKIGLPALIGLPPILEYGFGFSLQAWVAGSVGRDPTLTGRTHIWEVVLSQGTNPWFGAGYEGFWLGQRLIAVWNLAGGVNEAHNGYIEVYLNLGFLGLFVLGLFLLGGYQSLWGRVAQGDRLGSFGIALWAVLLMYNLTESALKIQLMFVAFLLGAIVVPMRKVAASTRRRPSEMRPVAAYPAGHQSAS